MSEQASVLLVGLLIRLDKKICKGVDDSDGIVGGFMREVAEVLLNFVKFNPDCAKSFVKLCGLKTCFEWQKSLVEYFDNQYS